MTLWPHFDPCISGFQNDIILATGWVEQRRPVWLSQTRIVQRNPPRSRQAVTDRPTMDPPLTSAGTPGSAGQGQVDERIFMSLFSEPARLRRSLAASSCLAGAWGRTTLHKCRFMKTPAVSSLINPCEEPDDLRCPAEPQEQVRQSSATTTFTH